MIIRKVVFFISIMLGSIVFFTCSSLDKAPLYVEELTCDYYENPVGIESQHPTFSWIVEANEEQQSQSAFHILVASSPEKLNENNADIWNSGKVNSSQSAFLDYEGSELSPMKRYWWKVKVWSQDGHSSEWSARQFFETGLMQEENWLNAEWIALNTDQRESSYKFREVQTERMEQPVSKTSYPVGYFRKKVEVSKNIKDARLYISGLGYSEAFINGEKTGDYVLDPSPTSYDHHALYVIHDVAEFLKIGENTIGLMLGNGFYGQTIAFNGALSYGRPAAKILLKIQYSDGSSKIVTSDHSWKVSAGPIVFDNVYAGETYDARYEIEDWNTTGFDASNWRNASVVEPVVGELRAQLLPPVKKIKSLSPVDIFEGEQGNWIVDFGQNISGWVKVKMNEKRGKEIKFLYAEALTRKGDAVHPGSAGKFATGVDQIDRYICKGSTGWEKWEPRFTYHGFRYVEISGLTEPPSKETIQAILVHNDLEETGSFECSDDLLNQMVSTSKWTVVDNLHGFPEDCPHREKCGWLGDAQVASEFCLFSYDMAGFYSKYMEDIRSNQMAVKGKFIDETFRVPTMIAPGKRKAGIAALDWGIAEIYLPWYHYLHNGDFSLIEKYYTDMKDLVEYYLSFKNDKGIIENGLGDWCPPRWDRHDNPEAMECHPFVSANAYFYDVLGIMYTISQNMNDESYADFLISEREQLKTAYNNQFIRNIGDDNLKWYGSQTGTVMALRFDMVPDSVHGEVVKALKFDISEIHDGHHSTGIHGNRYIYSVLNELGEGDLSYHILTNPEFPSQAYILNSGMTTWPERQWEWDSGIEWDRSLNHPMHSGFAAFFYESLGGIRPMKDHPGFKEFRIQPVFWPHLEFANASIKSPYGEIASQWERQDERINLKVSIPFNTKAHLTLPVKNLSRVKINNKAWGDFTQGPISKNGKKNEITLGAGTYSVSFPNPERN